MQLENGEVKEADIVVVNADLVWAYNHLFKEEDFGTGANDLTQLEKSRLTRGKRKATDKDENLLDEGFAKRLSGKAHSCACETIDRPRSSSSLLVRCSSISFYWAMDSQIPSLNAHNIFLVSCFFLGVERS